jgi:uncharacterized membrane protein YcaP (DUF421 family)
VEEYLGFALRVTVVYVFALLVLRISGKRSIGHITPLDFAIATLLGDLFDDMFWAEVPLVQGIAALGVIVFWHSLVEFAASRSSTLDRILSGKESLLVKAGRVVEQNLRKERLPRADLYADLRVLQEERLQEIEASHLEPNGKLSIVKRPQFKIAQKKDKARLEELLR